MLHQFLQKLLISFFIFGQAFYAWPFQDIPSSIVNNFQKSLKEYNQILQDIRKTPTQTIIPSESKVRLTNNQLKVILYFSKESKNKMITSESCSLSYFIKNQNIIINDKRINKVQVEISTKDSKEIALIDNNLYAEKYLKDNCQSFLEREQLYSPNNIKSTINRITPTPPRNKKECYSQWDNFANSKDLPFICSRVDRILYAIIEEKFLENNPAANIQVRTRISNLRREKNLYRPAFSNLQYNYYLNLCKNFDSKENFCSNYISQDIWGLVLNSQEPKYKMDYKCQAVLKKKKLTNNDRQRCTELFRNKPHLCHFYGNLQDASLEPMPSCQNISKALTSSKLKSNYHDCPVRVANPAVVNFNRIMKHFFEDDIQIEKDNCVFPSFETVYKSYIKTKEENKWPIKLCYKDITDKEEKCSPYVPGNNQNVSYSQNVVVSDILYSAKLNETRPICNIAGPKYNPTRLRYRTNCWLVPVNKSCTKYSCPLNVILDGKNVLQVYTKGMLTFQYFQNIYNSNDSSLNSRLLNLYERKTSSISSVSSARFFLTNKENGIIHGLGCIEDIYPEKFKMLGPAQCRPIPFIIDGYQQDDELDTFTIRTALDDLHSPRHISWPLIYSAVERYSYFHPLKSWNLYGIY